MAEKARRRPKAETGKGAKGKAPPAPPPKGHNSAAMASDAAYEKWLPKLSELKGDADAAKEKYKAADGRYRSALKAAKQEGVNTDAVTYARNVVEKMEPTDAALFYRDVARVLEHDKHPVSQLDLFSTSPQIPGAVQARSDGMAAGKNGEPAENNPHVPGTEQHVAWAEGWVDGQEKLARDTLGGSAVAGSA